MVTFVVDAYSFSPNGLSLACVIQTEKSILVRNCEPLEKLKVEHKFKISNTPVDILLWSQDSAFIACGCRKHAVISIFSVVIKNWKCKISFGTLNQIGGIGLDSFVWTPNARGILSVSSEFTFMSVWSIRNKCIQYIKDIATIPHGYTFSPDGSLLAIAHMDDCGKPFLGIYSCKAWTKETSFPIACQDLAGISWSPNSDSDCIACWDSLLFNNLYIYDANKGDLLQQYSPYGLSSGFRTVEWTGSGHFLVGTTHRNEIHILNGLTFGILIHEVLEPTVAVNSATCDLFYEPNRNSLPAMNHRLSKWPPMSLEDSINDLPFGVLQLLSKCTVSVKMNSDGSYLACSTHLYPKVVWIYDLLSAKLGAVLIHQHPVLDFDWTPSGTPKLAIICYNSPGILYFWTVKSTAYIRNICSLHLTKSSLVSLKWSPQGSLLTVRDGDKLHVLQDL